MKSKDLVKQEFTEKMNAAMKSEDPNALAQTMTDFVTNMQESILEDAKEFQKTQDITILQKRGIHQLTQEETKFYNTWIDAAKSSNPRQAIANIDIALPETVIDNVMEDMKRNHPLLEMIEFQNMTALTKMIVNKQGSQLAVWGALNSAITAELSGSIGTIDLSLNKLTAFMPVSKDMLLVGPQWVDAYVRAVLSEAVALGLEEGIVNGTGKNMPIGMNRSVADDVSVTGGEYPKKEKIVITDLGVSTFGKLISTLATDPTDSTKSRPVDGLIMVVNPFDYYKKVMPATTIKLPDGTYKNNVLPYPVTIVQSDKVAEGEAILGIAKKYAMGIATSGKEGKIEYSDEYKFLEDERYYVIKLLANGRALDNNAFLLLDISGLEEMTYNVSVKGTVKTKEQA